MAVRLVVDRGREIRAFKPEEYWSIDAKFIPKGSRKQFRRYFTVLKPKNWLSSKEEVDKILEAVKDADFQITKLKKVPEKISGAALYHLHPTAGGLRKLGQARRTMKAARSFTRVSIYRA